MPSVDQLRNRLLKKLKELFQLDQPDLDFGFYRIMHAKAEQVRDFIEKDLLNIVEESFGQVGESQRTLLKAEYEKAIETAREWGAPDPENTPKVKEAKQKYEKAKDTTSAEGDIYDHLYRFFERYYDNGDFISRRYYARETSGRAAPFAIPYNGEEVKLHWANADQYYIKTAEYFTNFTFDLKQAKEVLDLKGSLGFKEDDNPLRVHFRIVAAAEGEHGNVKASEANKRFFIIHTENPVEFTEDNELVIHFEYRPDEEKSGQEGKWREKRNAEAVELALKRLEDLAAEKKENRADITEYIQYLKAPAPTEKDKNRPLLAKYINQYTARNTMDYFIHKDLGGFLRRELDFYIKNEVMRLDDIENADAPDVESYLSKIRVLRRIAGKLIAFLAQLEDFQKRLWLKKKFVVETNYCITLDRVPEELYPEIAVNEAQHDEWVKLFAIDEIEPDTFGNPGYARPLTVGFLKANSKLVLDTRFFGEDFKARLVAGVEDFDGQCDGLLIHSENFQALNLLQERYREQVKCVYIDPPYNTGGDGFAYKDSYQHSSWLSLIADRAEISKELLSLEGVFFSSCDDNEFPRIIYILGIHFGADNFVESLIWKRRATPPNDRVIGKNHEYIVGYGKDSQKLSLYLQPRSGAINAAYKNPDSDPRGPWTTSDLSANGKGGRLVESCVFPIGNPHDKKKYYPPRNKCWLYNQEKINELLEDGRIGFRENSGAPFLKRYLSEVRQGVTLPTIIDDGGFSSDSAKQIRDLFGEDVIEFPKPLQLMRKLIISGMSENETVLDYFAGSGTTAHAVINLNREDNGQRKYILVEMGDYFDTVLKPRIAKVVYSESWKDGKPTARHSGISHCFKTIRLESYEDTLNNLQFDENPIRSKAVTANPSLKEDYMLHYILDVETRGSQSLLNIDAFADPTAYTLKTKKPGSDEYVIQNVDLIETFNYMIGLRIDHIAAPQVFSASFKRNPDPELPEDQHTKLVVDGKIKQDAESPWWFRKVEGRAPKDPSNPNNGQQEKILIVWRRLTDDLEKDNLMLEEWFQKNRISTRDFEFDTIYVNGSNNLPNLRLDSENWKVRLIEEEFMKRMWEIEA